MNAQGNRRHDLPFAKRGLLWAVRGATTQHAQWEVVTKKRRTQPRHRPDDLVEQEQPPRKCIFEYILAVS